MPEKQAPLLVVRKSQMESAQPDAPPSEIHSDTMTAAPVSRTKPLSKKARKNREIIALAVSTFPALWPDVDKGKLRPMTVGIREQVKEYIDAHPDCGITFRQWIQAVRLIVSRIQYQRCVKEGKTRYDIFGEPAGVVTAQEAAYARLQVSRIRASRASRASLNAQQTKSDSSRIRQKQASLASEG